jgi:hypothetical protein
MFVSTNGKPVDINHEWAVIVCFTRLLLAMSRVRAHWMVIISPLVWFHHADKTVGLDSSCGEAVHCATLEVLYWESAAWRFPILNAELLFQTTISNNVHAMFSFCKTT